MAKLMTTKENIYTSIFKNGKIRHHGGAHLFKEMFKSTHKKLTLNLQNFLISKGKPDPLSKK